MTGCEKVKTSEELIEELKEMRTKLTRIYMKLGNPAYASADMSLRDDIILFEKRL